MSKASQMKVYAIIPLSWSDHALVVMRFSSTSGRQDLFVWSALDD